MAVFLSAGYFAHVVGQHRSDCVGSKSTGVSVAWLRLGEGFWMAFAARLTEESIIRAKHAPLGWVSPIQVVYIDEGLVQCLVDVGGFQGRDATCMLRMLTSRRCAQAHANGSKHPVLKHGPRSLTYVRVSG